MQVFIKRILITFLAVFLGISAVGCNKDKTTTESTPNDSQIPTLSNPDDVFLTTGDYTLTYQELYEKVKLNDGLNQLLNLVDTDLLSNYVQAVTADEIANRTLKLIYGTDDAEEIAKLTDDQKADLETAFEHSMSLLGYGEIVDEYVRLVCARENYAVDQMIDASNNEEAWYAGATAVAEWYNNKYQPNINAIKIRFMSETDAKTVLRQFNLVSKGGDLLLYTGETPIEQVPSSQFNETNTRTLADEEILVYFIKMYNYVYGDFRDLVSEDATLADLLANENMVFEYNKLKEANASLPLFMYESLGSYKAFTEETDDLQYYTYEPVKYYGSTDTSYYMLLNLDKTEKVEIEDFEGTKAQLVALIGQDLYDELQQEIIDLNLSASNFVSSRMVTLREKHAFNIYDYYLGKDYSNVSSDFEVDEYGHSTNVATYDNTVITADDLLKYALSYNLGMYTIYALQTKAVISAHYEDLYCVGTEDSCEYDVSKNTSEKMTEHYESYDALKAQFDASYYPNYYTFDEYVYLAYGVKDKYELIYEFYVKSSLQPLLIYDKIISSNYEVLNYLMELSQPYYDNYFSLNVEHILIFMDRDENGQPDNYKEYYRALEDTTIDAQKLADFELALRTYLENNDNDMFDLVSEYKKAKRDDVVWGEFKAYGFNLLTEVIGETNYKDSVDKDSKTKFELEFTNALINLYQEYNEVQNINKEFIVSDTLTETSYGLHIIKVEKGKNFDKPSALFTMTYDDDLNPEYLEGLVNISDELTIEQLKIYADYRFTVIAYGNGNFKEIYGLERPKMPKSVLNAIETYVQDLYDALYVVGYLNGIVIDQLQTADYVNSITDYTTVTKSEFLDRLDSISEIYEYQIFANYDHRNLD